MSSYDDRSHQNEPIQSEEVGEPGAERLWEVSADGGADLEDDAGGVEDDVVRTELRELPQRDRRQWPRKVRLLRQDLRLLRGKENVSPEMNSLRSEDAQLKAEAAVRFLDMFRLGELRWPLFIAVMMMFSQQLSGINVAMYYSTQVPTRAA